jgi:cobaltochelatase CobT
VSKIEISSPISCKRLVDENLRGIISRIKSPLKRVFHDQNYVSNSLHNRGKSISSSRLASVAIGNIKVFDSQSIHRSPNAAIALLIDKSGSMDDEDIKMANSVAYSLSTALDGIEGVESLVAYYPKQFDDIELAVVKAFEEKKSIQSFNIESYGGTPTAEAIQSVTSLLMTRSEPRKLLFVITDGDPNSVSDTETAIEEAQALGVKVFGIGIKQHVRGFTEADFHVIHSTKELVNALTVGLKHAFK